MIALFIGSSYAININCFRIAWVRSWRVPWSSGWFCCFWGCSARRIRVSPWPKEVQCWVVTILITSLWHLSAFFRSSSLVSRSSALRCSIGRSAHRCYLWFRSSCYPQSPHPSSALIFLISASSARLLSHYACSAFLQSTPQSSLPALCLCSSIQQLRLRRIIGCFAVSVAGEEWNLGWGIARAAGLWSGDGWSWSEGITCCECRSLSHDGCDRNCRELGKRKECGGMNRSAALAFWTY